MPSLAFPNQISRVYVRTLIALLEVVASCESALCRERRFACFEELSLDVGYGGLVGRHAADHFSTKAIQLQWDDEVRCLRTYPLQKRAVPGEESSHLTTVWAIPGRTLPAHESTAPPILDNVAMAKATFSVMT